ncbi:MAG: UxaA family hydrolase, partial [Acidobacteria bacterium]|nr:UxaA family hydrolase [Acidobacteriota bacterium]
RMSGDMDINAGRIMTGEATVEAVGQEIYEKLLAVAGGEETQAERLGHREYCVPYKYQELCGVA